MSFRGIKPQRAQLVKTLAWAASLFFFPVLISQSWAFDVETLKVEVSRKSISGRVYLFEHEGGVATPPGRIFLIRENGEPSAAFKIIRSYPEKSKFAAVPIKKYGATESLPDGSEHLASFAEPGAVWDPSSAEPFPEGKTDQELLEALDSPPPASVPGKTQERSKPSLSDEEILRNLEIREVHVIDELDSWLSAQFGLLRSQDALEESAHYSAFGLRYAATLSRGIWKGVSSPQYSWALEGSVFYFIVSQYSSALDDYTIVPIGITIRYNLVLSDAITFFGYGGFWKPFAISSFNPQTANLNKLTAFRPAIGLGLFYTMVPHWQIRLDAGWDMFGAGLVLRF